MELRVELLPTSWRFGAGHAVRLAVAGADVDSFRVVPDDGPPPTFSVHHGGRHAAYVELPVMPDAATGT